MSIIDQLKAELKDMNQDERMQLLDLITGEAKAEPEPEKKVLGVHLGPSRRGPRGEQLTEEQWYDLHNPPQLLSEGYTESLNFNGVKKVKRWSEDEIRKHNQEIMEAWIQAKREYAAKHGLTFSDEYNPPEEVKCQWVRPGI